MKAHNFDFVSEGNKEWRIKTPLERIAGGTLPEALSNPELLAVLVGNEDIAREALCKAQGRLRGAIDADQAGLVALGMDAEAACRVAVIRELACRYLAEGLPSMSEVRGTADAAKYLKGRIGMLEHEVFGLLFLDNRHRVLAFEELFSGTIDGAAVYPREVVKRVLHHNAASVILTHNHPSGVPEPSQADRAITKRLVETLEVIDVRVLDHILVGKEGHTSFAKRGLI